MAKHDLMAKVVFVLVIAGGLNWLGESLGFNLVEKLFGDNGNTDGQMLSSPSQWVYLLVGLSTVMFANNHWDHHMGKGETMKKLVFLLVVVGGVVWLGESLGFNLVEKVTGDDGNTDGQMLSSISQWVYLLVGLSTVMFASNNWDHHMN